MNYTLSPRLSIIADEIEKKGNQDIVYDIGADHAYLPIYLVKKQLCRTVAATDISPSSLTKARINAIKNNTPVFDGPVAGFQPSGSIILYTGDGLNAVPDFLPGKIVIVAGIGAPNLIGILERGLEHAKAASLLILQPMSSQERLRAWLLNNSFEIINERLAREGNRIYSIILTRYSDNPPTYAPEDIYLGCRVRYNDRDEYTHYLRFTRLKIANRYRGLIISFNKMNTRYGNIDRIEEAAQLKTALDTIDSLLISE